MRLAPQRLTAQSLPRTCSAAQTLHTRQQQRTALKPFDYATRRRTVAAQALSLAAVQSFVSQHALAVSLLVGAIVALALIANSFRKGSRPYGGNVGEEYDAWTQEGILEHYWGDHIHLGYYGPDERKDGATFAWRKDFKEVRKIC